MISEWYHKPATNDRQQQYQQSQRDVSAAGNISVQSAPVITGVNTTSCAAMSDDMDTTVLYHDGTITSVVNVAVSCDSCDAIDHGLCVIICPIAIAYQCKKTFSIYYLV